MNTPQIEVMICIFMIVLLIVFANWHSRNNPDPPDQHHE